MDGSKYVVPTKLVNDRPTQHEWECDCGGKVYASPSSRFATCSNGEIRCTRCRRKAHRFGRGLTCGPGCEVFDA